MYEVIVSNIGHVYVGDDREKAGKDFAYYIEKSRHGRGRGWNEIVTLLFDGRVVNEYNPDVPESHAVFEITLEKGCERVLWPVPLYLIGPRQIRISDLEYQLNQREDIRSVHFLGRYNRVVITQDANFPFQEVLK